MNIVNIMDNSIIQQAVNVMRILERKIKFQLNYRRSSASRQYSFRYNTEYAIDHNLKPYNDEKLYDLIKTKYEVYCRIYNLLSNSIDIFELNTVYLNSKLNFVYDDYLLPINNKFENIKYPLIDHKNKVAIMLITDINKVYIANTYYNYEEILHESIILSKNYKAIVVELKANYYLKLPIYCIKENRNYYEDMFERQMIHILHNEDYKLTLCTSAIRFINKDDHTLFMAYIEHYMNYYKKKNITPKEEILFLRACSLINTTKNETITYNKMLELYKFKDENII